MVEVICTIVYSLTFATDLTIKGVLHIAGDRIYGYTIVVDTVSILSWFLSLALLYRERVLVVTQKLHGLTLALFWLFNMIWLGLQLVSLRSPSWWWQLTYRRVDIADLTLFIVRVVLMVVLVLLGLLRPLFCCCYPSRRRTYSLLINADETAVDAEVPDTSQTEAQRRKEGDFVRSRTTSAFSNMWHKVCLLFPYVWPKGIEFYPRLVAY